MTRKILDSNNLTPIFLRIYAKSAYILIFMIFKKSVKKTPLAKRAGGGIVLLWRSRRETGKCLSF
jgi:hypothetical protein